jgi:DDE_Tnp_1-associated/Transposase DDE domain
MRIMPWETTLDQFASCWQELDDPRSGNAAPHDFLELLMIAFCAVLCGGQGAVDMAIFAKAKEPYLRGFLKLANGLPSHDTFSRLFRRLDPDQFGCVSSIHDEIFDAMSSCYRDRWETVAPFVRPSQRQIGLAHSQRTWGCERRLVLAQIATDEKSNEITAVPKLLEMLSLKGTIVTVDALNCQRAIAEQIVKQGGDYVLALKGNQGGLHQDVCLYLDDPACNAATAKPVVDADHGRIETRTASVSTDIGCRKTINGRALPRHRQSCSNP